MRPPAPRRPDRDAEDRNAIAAALLFTTEPTDRALTGWCGTEWADEELAALGLRRVRGIAATGTGR